MGILRGRYLLLFWLGFCCDTAGTTLMGRIAGGPIQLSFHGVEALPRSRVPCPAPPASARCTGPPGAPLRIVLLTITWDVAPEALPRTPGSRGMGPAARPAPSRHCRRRLRGGCPDESVSARQSRAAWARLLAKIYEVDALKCSRCGSPMKVLTVITDPTQVRRILLHLIKTGAAPPGLDASALN
jgi:hypothetical protein